MIKKFLEVFIHCDSLTCQMPFRHFVPYFWQKPVFIYRSQSGKASYSTAHQPRSSLAPDHWHPSCSASHRWCHRALAVPQPSTAKRFASQTDGVSRPPHSRQRTQHGQQHHSRPAQPKTNGPPGPVWSAEDLHQGLHRHAHTHPHALPRTHGGESAPAFSLPVLTGYLQLHQLTHAAACLPHHLRTTNFIAQEPMSSDERGSVNFGPAFLMDSFTSCLRSGTRVCLCVDLNLR